MNDWTNAESVEASAAPDTLLIVRPPRARPVAPPSWRWFALIGAAGAVVLLSVLTVVVWKLVMGPRGETAALIRDAKPHVKEPPKKQPAANKAEMAMRMRWLITRP